MSRFTDAWWVAWWTEAACLEIAGRQDCESAEEALTVGAEKAREWPVVAACERRFGILSTLAYWLDGVNEG